MIVGITNSRLSQVAYDYNTQFAKADQTIEKLVTNMIIGEAALPIESRWCTFLLLQQILTEISAIDTFTAIIVLDVSNLTHNFKDCNVPSA